MAFWWILIIVLIIAISMWFRRFLQGVKKVQAAQREVEKEMNEIGRLSLSEAEIRAQRLLSSEALTREWPGPLSAELDVRVNQLEPTTGKLVRKFRTIRFRESETEIFAEFLIESGLPDGLWMIGLNAPSNYKLGVKPGSPIVYEASESRIRESYPSVFHYMLQIEALD